MKTVQPRAAIGRKFSLAVHRKIKPIGANYALTRAGISFGKDCLPRRNKPQPRRFVNREILISRRVVIARQKQIKTPLRRI